MTTFRKKSTNTYKRYTPVQLATTLRQLQRQFIVARNGRSTVRGKTTTQQCNAIASEIRKVASVLRSNVTKQINVKIRTLRSQYAKNIGVKISSPKSASTATKRLKAKLVQIKKCTRVTPLINLCTGIKWSTFKNPSVRTVRTSTTAKKTKRTRTTKSYRRSRTTASHAKYKRQAKSLKREVHKLKRRNSFMRRLVNQFRKKVAKLQRSYRASHAKPRWKVVHGRGTSNVVRLHRTTAWKQQQRRAS